MNPPGQNLGLRGVRRDGRAISPAASQSRQVLQEQKRIGQRAPTPGDGLDDGPSVTGRFTGTLTVAVTRSQTVDEPGERRIIAHRR